MNFKIIVLLFFISVTLNAETTRDLNENGMMKKIEYDKAVSLYVNTISIKIAQELYKNTLLKKMKNIPMSILPIVNLYDNNQTTLATQKIDENLIHEMFMRGYKIVDSKTLNKINESKEHRISKCVLYSTYTNYKSGMLINSRIIDTNSSILYATSQVFVTKKELKSINKLYNKYGWFSE
ncbi:MAG: FlgO family outer membrane protein [Sulfurimonas sp.]